MTRRVIGGAAVGVVYFVFSQLVGLAYLFLAAVFGWQVRGYHEPAEYDVWTWLVFAVWVAGFVFAVWWGAFRLVSRPEPAATGAP
jgi:hypothetical protein